MADKESRNEHYLSQLKLGEWFCNAQYYYRPRNDKERNLMRNSYEEGYNNGFSKGLAEGKPKWHDLRKDPNDLPKQITLVIMYIIGNAYCNGWFNGDGWIIDNGNMKKIDCENVIAWCELPKFEE